MCFLQCVCLIMSERYVFSAKDFPLALLESKMAALCINSSETCRIFNLLALLSYLCLVKLVVHTVLLNCLQYIKEAQRKRQCLNRYLTIYRLYNVSYG